MVPDEIVYRIGLRAKHTVDAQVDDPWSSCIRRSSRDRLDAYNISIVTGILDGLNQRVDETLTLYHRRGRLPYQTYGHIKYAGYVAGESSDGVRAGCACHTSNGYRELEWSIEVASLLIGLV